MGAETGSALAGGQPVEAFREAVAGVGAGGLDPPPGGARACSARKLPPTVSRKRLILRQVLRVVGSLEMG